MSEIISLNSVELAYPIYSVRAQSLRNTIASMAVGGKLLKDGKDIIHIKALSGVTFTLYEGDRLGVIGHNGAGKTTLLKVIAGIYEPDRGAVNVNGRTSSMIDITLGSRPYRQGKHRDHGAYAGVHDKADHATDG